MSDNKESLSFDKIESLKLILWGSRSNDFSFYWNCVPDVEIFNTRVSTKINSKLEAVIFDLDGTLVPPYAAINDDILKLLYSYKEQYKVIIYSNSPSSPRLLKLKEDGIDVVDFTGGKPSLSAFKDVCKHYSIDSNKTAMVGNFPLTDMPLVGNKEKPFFPINILIKSIPPKRRLVESTKKFIRAYAFHLLCVKVTYFVRLRRFLTRKPL